MTIPNLKRIKINSEVELSTWLTNNADLEKSVMLVTFNKNSPEKHVSHDAVHSALKTHGWTPGRRYTLNANLIGHVIARD